MRDVKRIETLMSRLGKLWKEYCPDVRFGQLMFDFSHWHQHVHKADLFFVDDDIFATRFEEYLIASCGKPVRKT